MGVCRQRGILWVQLVLDGDGAGNAAGLVEQQPALRTFKLAHLRAAHRQNGQVPTEKIIGIIRKFVLFIGGYGCTAFHMRVQQRSAILGEQTGEPRRLLQKRNRRSAVLLTESESPGASLYRHGDGRVLPADAADLPANSRQRRKTDRQKGDDCRQQDGKQRE